MGSLSIWHWLIVGVLVMLLFGKGRFSDMMGDVAKGLKSFKKGMADEEDERPVTPPSRIDAKPAAPAAEPAFDRDGEKLREERP
ncbi:twin-arginine translocase TatA/TatE family subunit [Sphingomonas sp. PB4P5]|uniref:twin-arginine translocase TatA/TatE family subunit n=1 Tax=Parasphingomonas puruogangriensis TaxID=3096155 RepID=UPI002FCA2F81